MSQDSTLTSATKIKVWDFPTRLFHWCLLIGIITSWASVKTDNMEIHINSAAFVLGLLIFRITWGLWGASTAQFQHFIPSPKTLLNYLKNDLPDNILSIGHSPLGALSVIGLLLAIGVQAATGLVADDEIFITGPLIDYVSSDTSSWATSLHVKNADILLGLIVLHLAAIAFYLTFKKNNLIVPMITGYKTLKKEEEGKVIEKPLVERSILVFCISAAIAIAVPYIIFNLL